MAGTDSNAAKWPKGQTLIAALFTAEYWQLFKYHKPLVSNCISKSELF